ncbi:MAG: NAD(P)-dependent oxidoreductase, partial [Chitinophagaceae bacterium]
DISPDSSLVAKGISYVTLEELLQQSTIISLHCPLTKENHYLINNKTVTLMKPGVTLVNTSRGGLINTLDIIEALKTKKVAALCIDVYEQEEKLFFRDLSSNIIGDDTIQRLMSFPNVLITAHQAFFTEEALTEIAQITLDSISKLDKNSMPENSAVMLT